MTSINETAPGPITSDRGQLVQDLQMRHVRGYIAQCDTAYNELLREFQGVFSQLNSLYTALFDDTKMSAAIAACEHTITSLYNTLQHDESPVDLQKLRSLSVVIGVIKEKLDRVKDALIEEQKHKASCACEDRKQANATRDLDVTISTLASDCEQLAREIVDMDLSINESPSSSTNEKRVSGRALKKNKKSRRSQLSRLKEQLRDKKEKLKKKRATRDKLSGASETYQPRISAEEVCRSIENILAELQSSVEEINGTDYDERTVTASVLDKLKEQIKAEAFVILEREQQQALNEIDTETITLLIVKPEFSPLTMNPSQDDDTSIRVRKRIVTEVFNSSNCVDYLGEDFMSIESMDEFRQGLIDLYDHRSEDDFFIVHGGRLAKILRNICDGTAKVPAGIKQERRKCRKLAGSMAIIMRYCYHRAQMAAERNSVN